MCSSHCFPIKKCTTLFLVGFGLCGIPESVIDAIRQKGVKELTIISNTGGIFDYGVGMCFSKSFNFSPFSLSRSLNPHSPPGLRAGRLLHTHQVDKMLASYVGENAEFEQEFLDGELEVEFVPQGTLVERVRAGGAGTSSFAVAHTLLRLVLVPH